MRTILYLSFILCIATGVSAKTKEFTILGGEKIKAEVKRGTPLPAEKDGIRIEAAAFMVGEGALTFSFGFTIKKKPSKVVVEDVTGTEAVVMVEDLSPAPKNDYWMGHAAPLPLTKAGVPWVFEPGDTTKVFRFTITLADQKEPVVLYQPAVYASSTKKKLLQLAQ